MEHIWEMPEIQALHRLPARSPLLPWADSSLAAQDAASGPENRDLSKNSFYKSLDGEWKFRFLESPSIMEAEPELELNGWTQKSYNDDDWNLIKVPGTWTRQGYDKPHYTNVQMPFENIPPKVPTDNPTGLYRLRFCVPEEWRGRRIVLHIGSAESVCMVWVNGRSVGCFKDTRLPSEFDITDYIEFSGCDVTAGENTVALMVVRYSDASFVEDQDQWWFGGIHRSVYLYSTEKMWIEDVEAVPDLCDVAGGDEVLGDVADGSVGGVSGGGASSLGGEDGFVGDPAPGNVATIPLKIRMGIKEDIPGNKKCSVSWKLYPVENAADMSASSLLPPVAEGTEELTCNMRTNLNEIRAKITVENPRIWSHETPNRYVLSLVLFDEDGRQIEACALCTAFRSVRTENRHLLINGKVVYIKGVNRHEHDEKTGKTLTTEAMVKDIRLLKAHNFNAVRTCHYPDDERWYELCDKYGIYLVDEANVENHYYYDGLCRSEMYSYAYMIRVQRMVRRDKNHPSIIMWSLGNESGHGWNQEMMYAWCHSFDKTRPVHYEGGTRAEYTQSGYSLETFARGKNVTDIVCPMYPDIQLVKEWAETTAGTDEKRPFIMCEYSHAMGNSNGSLSDYWNVIRSNDGLQGGFIWDWIDQGLEAFDENGTKYWKYGGDFGDEPTDRDFCLNGILLPDQSPKPVMKECFKVFQPVELAAVDEEKSTVTVENRFDFTSLDCLSLKWQLEEDGVAFAEGSVLLPAAAPGESVEVEVPFKEALADRLRTRASLSGAGEVGNGAANEACIGDAGARAVKAACAGNGEIVLHADFVYATQCGLLSAGSVAGWSEAVLRQAEKAETVEVTGLLAAAACEKKREELENSVFNSPLVPSVFRCPTENDDQKTMPNTNRIGHEWVELLMDKTSWDESSGIISADGKEIGSCNMKWSLVKAGSGKEVLELTTEFTLNDTLPEYPKIGLTAKISLAYESVKWYGKGAHESYNDRCAGSALGCYTSKLHDMETSYIVPQENGNRYGVRWLEISGGSKDGFRIEADTPFCFSVMHHEASDLWQCFHTNELTDTSANGYYILNLDIAQRGVGTATCGPDTLEQYRIRPGSYKAMFRFVF